jgi:hypothetical protein
VAGLVERRGRQMLRTPSPMSTFLLRSAPDVSDGRSHALCDGRAWVEAALPQEARSEPSDAVTMRFCSSDLILRLGEITFRRGLRSMLCPDQEPCGFVAIHARRSPRHADRFWWRYSWLLLTALAAVTLGFFSLFRIGLTRHP